LRALELAKGDRTPLSLLDLSTYRKSSPALSFTSKDFIDVFKRQVAVAQAMQNLFVRGKIFFVRGKIFFVRGKISLEKYVGTREIHECLRHVTMGTSL